MKILIAEDQPDARLLLKTLLEKHGYQVDATENGLQALDHARQSTPDLIISDLLMPNMDGFTLCRSIRGIPQLNSVPFVVYTGTYTESRDEQLALKLGANRFLTKSLPPKELLKNIEELFNAPQQASHSHRQTVEAVAPDIERMYQEALSRKLDKKLLELDKKRTALLDSERKFRTITDSAQDAILLIDREGKIAHWNPAAERIFGYPADQALHRDLMDLLIPRNDLYSFQAYFTQLQEADQEDAAGRLIELSALRDDGVEFPIELSMSRLSLSGQWHALALVRDITERKQAEAIIDKERSFLQTVIDGVGDPILVIRKDYKVILANKPAKEFCAEFSQTTQDATCYQLTLNRTTPCSGKAHPCPMQQVIDTRKPVRLVHYLKNDRQQTRTIELLAAPLHDEAGEVTGIIESLRDISDRITIENELIQKQKSLDHLAHHDTLTGLPNRLLFFDRLEQAMHIAHRNASRLALLFIDIDHFKEINDSLGHTLGDKLLKSVSRRLENNIREDDTVARLGGDEFTVIIGNLVDNRFAGKLAQKLIECLRNPIHIDGQDFSITASIGISIYPDDGTGSETLLKNADAAMYRAKSVGRNTFQFYTDDMTARAFERVRMESALRKALISDQFIVHYQPQLDLHNRQVICAEALIRWRHPEKGILPPSQFIAMAEESGQIFEIGNWILQFVCNKISDWQKAGLPLIPISVNISGRQLLHSSIVDSVLRILNESSCNTRYIELEITEGFLMQNPHRSANELKQLRDLGINIAIDDFGTGYSSLSHIKQFPLTKLKIDQSFIKDVSFDTEDQAIIRAIIALGKSLGLSTVAEGVEYEAQRNFLKAEGCDAAQGFLYSPPMMEKDFLDFLKNNTGLFAVPNKS
ncbi:MAG: EAL domain-containing protein [Gammaproteobacteria bacterium]|nr:EAL domain-containing protein [Gammaproteobacteria bacterium]